MPQYLAQVNGTHFILDEAEAAHLNVTRHKEGGLIKIFDGKGKKYEAVLETVSKKSASGRITAELEVSSPKYKLVLCFAPVSRTAVEEVLDKCTQAGVSVFCPVITDYTEHDISKKLDNKTERWRQIVMSACKQCETAFIPEILPPLKFADALKKYDTVLFAYEKEKNNKISSALKDVPPGGTVAVFIGPVGGWSEAEAEAALKAGAKPVTLGVNIMRAETACIAASVLALE